MEGEWVCKGGGLLDKCLPSCPVGWLGRNSGGWYQGSNKIVYLLTKYLIPSHVKREDAAQGSA